MKDNPIIRASREAFGHEPDPIEARPIHLPLIASLLAIEIGAVAAFVWWVVL